MIRLTPQEYCVIRDAAALVDMGIGEFMLAAALDAVYGPEMTELREAVKKREQRASGNCTD